MVVCDADGRILWLEGDPRVKAARVERIAFSEGMDWTEDSAGTNAIGTALAIDHAVQVFSAEHFLAEQHPWWCSAAPIHDPVTGALLGVVDISGPLRTAHPHSLGLVSAAAGMAEDALRFRRAADEERMRRAYLERTARLGPPPSRDGRPRRARADRRPGGWVGGAVACPRAAARCCSPAAAQALAEPLAGGASCCGAPGRAGPAGPPALRLELLGRDGPRARVGDGAPLRSRPRQAEILALLALHPEGLTGEQLTLRALRRAGNPVSTRAQSPSCAGCSARRSAPALPAARRRQRRRPRRRAARCARRRRGRAARLPRAAAARLRRTAGRPGARGAGGRAAPRRRHRGNGRPVGVAGDALGAGGRGRARGLRPPRRSARPAAGAGGRAAALAPGGLIVPALS